MFQNFIRISQFAGNRFDLTQANGGNSSVKTDDHLFIKSSGCYLSDVNENSGFTKIKLKPLQELFQNIENFTDNQIKEIVAQNIEIGKNPSIETGMHVLLKKYVLHTHPIVVNALTCHKEWQKIIQDLFPEAILISYATPGISLARKVSIAFKKQSTDKEKVILFLQSHGLVVSSDDEEVVVSETKEIIEKLEQFLNVNFDQYKTAEKICSLVGKIQPKYSFCHCCNDIELYEILKNNNTIFFQDYCIPAAYIYNTIALKIENLDDEKPIFNYIKNYNKIPQIILYKSRIYILANNIKHALEIESTLKEQLLLLDVLKNNARFLTSQEMQLIDEELLS